jgi:cytidylate kinase
VTVSLHRVIAIDGPAASGKSSVARELARQLGFAYVNSGAMYRAITWHILKREIDLNDAKRISRAVDVASIVCNLVEHESRIKIDNVDAAEHFRDDRVNKAVSQISTIPNVRRVLTEKMRGFAREHDLVVEGRDIGSVVFPDTPYKFYIDASPEVRSRRRAAEGQRDEIMARDMVDSSRRTSPLVISKDACVIDSSHLTIEGVVAEIIGRLKLKGFNAVA